MTSAQHAVRRSTALGGVFLLGLLVLAPHSALAAGGTDGDSNLSVTVTDGETPHPTPSTSTPPSSTPLDNGNPGGTTAGSGNGTPGSGNPAGNPGAPAGGPGKAPAAPNGEVSVAGMLYVGGLNTSAAPSLNPGEGLVTLWFTVRNASKSPIDAAAKFWMESAIFGNQLSVEENVAVTGLLPDETRVVSVQLHRGGQWTFINAHVTLTPPETVDGVALTPVTRDASLILFPWLISLILVVCATGFIIYWVTRGARRVVSSPIAVSAT